jgi:hypothetical protein
MAIPYEELPRVSTGETISPMNDSVRLGVMPPLDAEPSTVLSVSAAITDRINPGPR